jgi:biopolymer transport protein ExbD
MRFPHNVKIFRGQLDAAPFAGVFFLLLIFLFAQSSIIFTPGVPIRLPELTNLPGVTTPTISLAVDEDGVIYFENRISTEEQLREQLRAKVASSTESITLVIQADRQVRYETLVHLAVLARDVGIKDALLATRPPVVPEPLSSSP